MKRILASILSVTILAAALPVSLAGCQESETEPAAVSEQKAYPTKHTLYYKDSAKSSKAVATFFNSNTKQSEEVEMKKVSSDSDSVTFSCEGDCTAYNMVYVTCDNRKPTDLTFQRVAFDPCVSGWYKTDDDLLPYAVGAAIDYQPTLKDVTLKADGQEKLIHIWTPEDYDANADEKYATVYVLDGQAMVFTGKNGQEIKGCPVVPNQVQAMTEATGQKAIVVAIESSGERDFEMVPEIGESWDEKNYGEGYSENFEGMDGTEFASFIAKTIVPYVQENYNVYSDALHTSIAGYSLGGLEAFYIALEYPDLFGTTGALSPSFWEYEDDTWREYLGKKDFTADVPFLYIYHEPEPKEGEVPGPGVADMVKRLKELGYPEQMLAVHSDENGLHDSTIWRNIFSEFLTAMVYREVKPLQQTKQ